LGVANNINGVANAIFGGANASQNGKREARFYDVKNC